MKKILAFVAVAAAAVAMASADPILVGHGYFGVGLGSQVVDGEGKALDKDRTSWNFGSNLDFGAGLAINIPFGGYFGFQPGVDFYVNNVGYKYKDTTLSTDFDVTFNYMSIDIPLLLTAKVNKWNFAIGPYVSIPVGQVGATTKGTLSKIGSIETKTDTSSKYEHSWGSVGLELGVGYEERIGMGRLVFGGRYMLDFIPIEVIEKTDGKSTTQAKLFRRALAIDIGYKLPLSFFGL